MRTVFLLWLVLLVTTAGTAQDSSSADSSNARRSLPPNSACSEVFDPHAVNALAASCVDREVDSAAADDLQALSEGAATPGATEPPEDPKSNRFAVRSGATSWSPTARKPPPQVPSQPESTDTPTLRPPPPTNLTVAPEPQELASFDRAPPLSAKPGLASAYRRRQLAQKKRSVVREEQSREQACRQSQLSPFECRLRLKESSSRAAAQRAGVAAASNRGATH